MCWIVRFPFQGRAIRYYEVGWPVVIQSASARDGSDRRTPILDSLSSPDLFLEAVSIRSGMERSEEVAELRGHRAYVHAFAFSSADRFNHVNLLTQAAASRGSPARRAGPVAPGRRPSTWRRRHSASARG